MGETAVAMGTEQHRDGEVDPYISSGLPDVTRMPLGELVTSKDRRIVAAAERAVAEVASGPAVVVTTGFQSAKD